VTRLAGERILNLDLQQPLTWCDYAIEWVLGALLLFTPAAFGSTEAWSQQIFFAGVALLAVLMTVKLMTDHQSKLVWTWAYVPIIAYLAVVALSLIPLPAGLLKVISPGTIEEKARLLADLPNVADLTATSTISFDVWSTERGLRIVTAMSVLFIATVNVFRTPQQIKRLLALIVGAGTAFTLLTLAQNLTAIPGKPMIYWTFYWEAQPPHPNSGPFVGHAQLGQYLNLTLGATLALALVMVGETFAGEEIALSEVKDRLGEPKLRLVYLLVAVMAAMAVAVAWSVSRGAMIGLAVATVVATVLILVKRGWRRGETPLLVGIVGGAAIVLGAVVWFVFLPELEKRPGHYGISGGARLEILKQVPRMVAKWPVMGTGLESFEWVYPDFQDNQVTGPGVSDHAENDYAQTLTDTGIVGGIITVAFLVIIGANWLKAFRGTMPIHLASIGIAFSLVAVMVHSAADFAQRTPAVGMLSALLCGATLSLAGITPRRASNHATPQFASSPLPRLAVGVAMVAALGWALWSNHAVRMGEANYWVSDPTYTGGLDPNNPEDDQALEAFFKERIDGCELALRYDPKALYYIHYLNEFRWRKLSRKRDPKTHQIIWPDGADEQARQIVNELSQARSLCPTFGPLYILQGKVLWERLDKAAGVRLLQRGHDLKPIDPLVHFYFAEIAAAEGNWEEAVRWSASCFRQDRGYMQMLADLLVTRHRQPSLAIDVFEQDLHALYDLARMIPPAEEALQRRIRAALIVQLTRETERYPDEGKGYVHLADQLQADGQKEAAVEALGKAIKIEYANIEWRMRRARLLADLGRPQEAISDVELVLGMKPQMDEAKTLLDSLKKKKGP
jgi:tetratricopeptide (TPR) repeat protein